MSVWRSERQIARPLLLILAALLLCPLAGCGSGGGDGNESDGSARPAESSSASAVLGPVDNAAVVAFRADRLAPDKPLSEQSESVLDAAVTETSGLASDLDLGGYGGPVLYALVVDGDSSYYDEASGTSVSIPSSTFFPDNRWFSSGTYFPSNSYTPAVFNDGRQEGDAQAIMFALAPSPRDNVAITSLTTLAFLLTFGGENGLFPLQADDADRVNDAIQQALAPAVEDILQPPTRFDQSVTSSSLGDNSADIYALQLAALAQSADTSATPGLVALVHTVNDLADDDELNASYDAGSSVASYADFEREYPAALEDVAGAYGTTALQNRVKQMPAPDTTPVSDQEKQDNDDSTGNDKDTDNDSKGGGDSADDSNDDNNNKNGNDDSAEDRNDSNGDSDSNDSSGSSGSDSGDESDNTNDSANNAEGSDGGGGKQASNGNGSSNNTNVAQPATVTGLVNGAPLTLGQNNVTYQQGSSIIFSASDSSSPRDGSWLLAIALDRSGKQAVSCGNGSQISVRPAGDFTETTAYQAPVNSPDRAAQGDCEIRITKNEGPGGTLTGVFNGTLLNAAPGGKGSVAVTNGAFNVTLPAGGQRIGGESDTDGSDTEQPIGDAAPGTVVSRVNGTKRIFRQAFVSSNGAGQLDISATTESANTSTLEPTLILGFSGDNLDVQKCTPNSNGVIEAVINFTPKSSPGNFQQGFVAPLPGPNGTLKGRCSIDITRNDGPGRTLAGTFSATLFNGLGDSATLADGSFNVTLPASGR